MERIKVLADEFYFARHGQTANNAIGCVTGMLDIPLDETGVAQAREMASSMVNLPFVSCICSPMDRALVTAELLLAGRNDVKPVSVKGLEERGWGQLEGTPKCDLDDYDFAEKGVEPWEQFVERTVQALSHVEAPAPVLIVAHSGTFRVLCQHLKVNIVIKPVRNACPYKFYRQGQVWYVDDCGTPEN